MLDEQGGKLIGKGNQSLTLFSFSFSTLFFLQDDQSITRVKINKIATRVLDSPLEKVLFYSFSKTCLQLKLACIYIIANNSLNKMR